MRRAHSTGSRPHPNIGSRHPVTTGSRRRRRPRAASPRRARLGIALAVLGAAGLFAGGCSSGGSGPGVASIGTTTTTPSGSGSGTGNGDGSSGSSQLAFAHCMQTHGVPDFPDPNATGQTVIHGSPTSDLNPRSSTFQKAQGECKKYEPGGNLTPAQKAQNRAKLLQYAQCMRAHGVPQFPDPNATGGISINGGPGSTPNLNPSSPTFQSAQKACQHDLPGGGKGTRISHGSGNGPASGSGFKTGTAAVTTVQKGPAA